MGNFDRALRIYAGVILSSYLIYLNTSWAFLGLIPFISGVTGFCPIYTLTGIRTSK